MTHFRTLLSLAAAAMVASSPAAAERESAPKGGVATLRFPTPQIVEQVWTYRIRTGESQPAAGVLFCLGADPRDPEGSRLLTVVDDALFTADGIRQLLDKGVNGDDARIYLETNAPQREAIFARFDIDGDGSDEVLLTGRGGAGGTSLLTVFRVETTRVRTLYTGASRFGFVLLDVDEDGVFEIANPGFEWNAGADDVMHPVKYVIHSLCGDRSVVARTLSAVEFARLVDTLSECRGSPISGSVVRVLDRAAKKP